MKQEQDPAGRVSAQPAKPRRLLWVDDSRILLALYKTVFESMGFDVLATSSPEEALHPAWLADVDVVILDYDMPEIDGAELACLIKARHPMLPVVLYSGSGCLPETASDWVDAICPKPCPREQLLATIEQVSGKVFAHSTPIQRVHAFVCSKTKYKERGEHKMKTILFATVVSMAFGMAATAQTKPTTPSPSDTTTQYPSQSSPNSDMSNSADQNMANKGKDEQKLKGCIRSANGSYMLEQKHGKEVALSGSPDFASHVGHTVTVQGSWDKGSNSSAGSSATSSAGTSSPVGRFTASKLDMVSENCKADGPNTSQDHNTSDNSKPNPNHK